MLFALRDDKGNLVAVGEHKLSDHWQELDIHSDEARQFFQRQGVGTQALEDSDLQFIRVLDDLIELLIEKQAIQFTELPEPAQKKLLKRRWFRQQLKGDDDTTHLMDPEEDLL